MFSLDEFVVYPAQGVGKIERIETQEIGGVPTELIIVRILSNNVTLMVPVKTAQNVGLRDIYVGDEGKKTHTEFKVLGHRIHFSKAAIS